MIEGNYTGTTGTGALRHHQPGINNPQSKFSNAGWGIDNYVASKGSDFFNTTYSVNVLEFGTAQTNGDMDRAALTPEEAWNIDTKIDDGKPARGKVISRRIDGTLACTDAADENDLDADYLLSQPSILCALLFNDLL